MFTLANWIIFAVLFVFAIAIVGAVIYVYWDDKYGWKPVLVSILAAVVFLGGVMGLVGWYNTHTASGARALKDNQSNLANGIDREITITAEDGRVIFHYEGKVDVESNHVDNYIKFESEEGKRYIVYYGIQDTITIIEK